MLNYRRLSFYCIIAASFLAPIIGGQFDLIYVSPLYILIALGLVLLYIPSLKEPSAWPRTGEQTALAAFLAISGIATARAAGLHAGITQMLALTAYVMAFSVAARLGKQGREWVVVSAITGAGAILGITAIAECQATGQEFQRLTGMPYRAMGTYPWGAFRVPGFFNPGFFAGFLAMGMPLALGLYCAARKPAVKWFSGLSWLLQLSALLLTGTRLGALAVFVALLAFLVFLQLSGTLTRRAVLSLALLAALSIIPLALFHGAMTSRVAATQAQSHSFAFRKYTWLATLHMIQAYPVLGVGPGAFQLVFPRFAVAGFTRLAHCSYLQFAAEAGVPALIAFLAGVGYAFRAAFRGLRRRLAITGEIAFSAPLLAGLMAAIVGSLARNIADSDWFVPGIGIVFFLCLGLASGAGRRMSEKDLHATPIKRLTAVVCVMLSLVFIAVVWPLDTAAYYAQIGNTAASGGEQGASEAVEDYTAAVRYAPFSAQYRIKLAMALARLGGGTSECEAQVREAIRLEPTSPSGYLRLGDIQQASGLPEEALASYRRAEERDPKSPLVKIAIADVLEYLHRRQEAIEVYKQIVDIEKSPYETVRAIPELVDPTYAYAHLAIGKMYLSQGDKALAVSEFRTVVDRIDRRSKFDYMLKADRLASGQSGSDERAKEAYDQAKKYLARLAGRGGRKL